ncbi:ferredoxin-type protein NapF [Alginatibacterium sediminis]|uniref:Ferredoxin-type protein NapF n=1 Tax=Alginatibacterium sediminis TaxID=2164068 RepID=A0A420EHQ3_9ALTE|nr:ferredoxin-type protein NapF [Alginatibacterium sediminis]RKF20213.1 ferredoxin-type protein NapF [Alginatibacterium sediminis]
MQEADQSKRRLFNRKLKQRAPFQSQLPWLKTEKFESDCTRCGKCVEACPTKVIVNGDGGYPVLDFRKAECELCYACSETCPESLFHPNSHEPWQQEASIDSSRCLNTQGVYCRSCADSCEPEALSIAAQIGGTASLEVDSELCSSCGACITVCPAQAISIKVIE